MNKLYTLLGAIGFGAASAFADTALTPYAPSTTSTVGGIDAVTGTGGILQTIADVIATVADKAWPIILAIVGVGLLFWLGRAMIRAVRSYFSTAM